MISKKIGITRLHNGIKNCIFVINMIRECKLAKIDLMSKLRYDEDENLSRHAAVNPDDCKEMEKKYGWELIKIEELPLSINQVFEVDCVFLGKTEFPKSFYDKEEN
jgi:hypothetical protein